MTAPAISWFNSRETARAGEQKRERNERHAEEMRELYYTFAHDPEQPAMMRLSAATHLLNRIDGLPVAKVVTSEADDISLMTDEELEAELACLEAKLKSVGDDGN